MNVRKDVSWFLSDSSAQALIYYDDNRCSALNGNLPVISVSIKSNDYTRHPITAIACYELCIQWSSSILIPSYAYLSWWINANSQWQDVTKRLAYHQNPLFYVVSHSSLLQGFV